jgi:hypothetical protein
LQLIQATSLIQSDETDSLKKEAEELVEIAVSILKKVRS